MPEILSYCPRRGGDVRRLLSDTARESDAQAVIPDPTVLCLSIGVDCTDPRCPLGGGSAVAMDAQLARLGLGPDGRRTVLGACAGCGQTTELALSLGGYASCRTCGTTQRLSPFPA